MATLLLFSLEEEQSTGQMTTHLGDLWYPIDDALGSSDASRKERPLNRFLSLIALLLVTTCKNQEPTPRAGDARHGKQLIEQYGCNTCHIIPGIDGPNGMVGPSLEHVVSRQIIASSIPNTPQNMMAYIQNPQAANPQNVMPNLGIKPEEARDIAAYLYTLK